MFSSEIWHIAFQKSWQLCIPATAYPVLCLILPPSSPPSLLLLPHGWWKFLAAVFYFRALLLSRTHVALVVVGHTHFWAQWTFDLVNIHLVTNLDVVKIHLLSNLIVLVFAVSFYLRSIHRSVAKNVDLRSKRDKLPTLTKSSWL